MKSEIQSGCRLHPSCESCPFPYCIVDDIPSLLRETKILEAKEMVGKGMPVAEVARRLEITERTVFNYLKRD